MLREVPVMCDRLAERSARGSGAAAHAESARAASSGHSAAAAGPGARRAHGCRAGAVTP